ncbi:hypothetical protein P43SY_007621 [Pythium insidiosum]|uniref:Choline transporter-like protein n=1 Tax=Pythium insidiosum TaxID=114742 RepID=A0AAD5LHE8_PYTIN|nr:hypothetical protein P43SY_007621 [Pythium insidiosum]
MRSDAAPLSPQGEEGGDMEELVLSPAQTDPHDEMEHEDYGHEQTGEDEDEESGSRLIPLSMSDGSSGGSSSGGHGAGSYRGKGRPLPSLHAPRTFRDLQFVGMYGFHLLLMLLATGYIRADFQVPEDEAEFNVAVLEDSNSKDNESPESVQAMNAEAIGGQLRSLCVVNFLFSLGWLLIFLFNDKMRFVQGSCAFSTIGLVVLALALFAVPANSYALIFGIVVTTMAVFDIFWIRKYKNGLDFVAVLFELLVDFLVKHPLLAYVTVGTLIIYTLWACWISTSLGFVGNGASPWQFSMIFLYFHFYWTSNILKNILTVVVSGATIIWYYKDDSSDLSPQTVSDHPSPSDESVDIETSGGSTTSGVLFPWKNTPDRRVVLHFLRCALTTSLGSIFIGSLLCPLAHIIWNVLRWARRDESTFSRRFVALRSEPVEQFIRTYHKYSFVFVAGYGKPFYAAAQESWHLISSRGVEAIVDDDLTSRLLLLGANGWASVMCALCVPAFSSTPHAVYFSVTSFVLCYTTISIAMQVLGAVVKTLFVCFAENPGRLSQLHPLIYHRFARLAELKSFRDHKSPPHSVLRHGV